MLLKLVNFLFFYNNINSSNNTSTKLHLKCSFLTLLTNFTIDRVQSTTTCLSVSCVRQKKKNDETNLLVPLLTKTVVKIVVLWNYSDSSWSVPCSLTRIGQHTHNVKLQLMMHTCKYLFMACIVYHTHFIRNHILFKV